MAQLLDHVLHPLNFAPDEFQRLNVGLLLLDHRLHSLKFVPDDFQRLKVRLLLEHPLHALDLRHHDLLDVLLLLQLAVDAPDLLSNLIDLVDDVLVEIFLSESHAFELHGDLITTADALILGFEPGEIVQVQHFPLFYPAPIAPGGGVVNAFLNACLACHLPVSYLK